MKIFRAKNYSYVTYVSMSGQRYSVGNRINYSTSRLHNQIQSQKMIGRIEFKNVKFSYPIRPDLPIMEVIINLFITNKY